ncbi:FecR domain-containing protein [Larkinella sp. VNQ87]|uniref:FecR domain-containing protein n=1 Tax=Larkinella sp. VNQ87 TaxID=3400921 RepID=UPI003C0F10A5
MNYPDYRSYSVDDLTRDERFRRWVIDRNPQSETFWSEWLADNPDCTDKVQLARAFLQALEEKNTALPPDELDRIFTGILASGQPRVVPLWRRSAFRVAASLVLLLGLGYGVFRLASSLGTGLDVAQDGAGWQEVSPALLQDYTEVVNQEARPKTVRLQDSSSVVLYSNARLRYPNRFDPARREVYLSGRAFFSITKNPKKPFWVYTDDISTQVLGTSFYVTAGAGDAKVEVRTGRVSVYRRQDMQKTTPGTLKNKSDGVVLTPNQQVVFSKTEQRLLKSVVDQPVALKTVAKNEYLFDETPMAEVFDRLEKTYGLTVIYDATTLSNCYLTANLAGESLFEKLNLICKITRSSYEMVDGQIVIYSNGCENK